MSQLSGIEPPVVFHSPEPYFWVSSKQVVVQYSVHVDHQSMRVWTCVQLALDYRGRVQALVLADTIGGVQLPSRVDRIAPVIETLKTVGEAQVALGAHFRNLDQISEHFHREISAFSNQIKS
ncbi:hypothetical protein GFB49_06245 [Epibacterium sp. SM1979]|uniref:Uncharacterized protein n=1 Tax=Tritonibacter litoralis TaxID=2662264 RepID=A0A843YAS1_9RHOB|nr:hypothetical protein [Tritonibacter litoralis]MQQ08046.1 hypothetical protein [Tritonibacter litoralis]